MNYIYVYNLLNVYKVFRKFLYCFFGINPLIFGFVTSCGCFLFAFPYAIKIFASTTLNV